MNHPTVSVLMPVYNGEKFLREAIDSILNQTYQDFEFIIINDGSTDSTEEIILSYDDARIVYVKNEVNLRLIKTLNKGIDIAKGKYIARMDADDVSLPNRLEEQVKAFLVDSDIDILQPRSILLDEKGKVGHLYLFSVGAEAIRYIIPFTNLVTHPAIMIKADILKSYKYRDEEIALHIEDWDLWMRLLNDGYSIQTIEKPLFLYRLTSTSINHLHEARQRENRSLLLREYLKCFGFLDVDAYVEVLISGNESISFNSYIQIKRFFRHYFNAIKKKDLISKGCEKDLIYWRNYLLLKKGLFALKNESWINKIRIIFQLIQISPLFYVRYGMKFF